MTEKEWVDEFLNGNTWGWEDMLVNQISTDDLDNGQLKQLINDYLDARSALEEYLEALGYEAG